MSSQQERNFSLHLHDRMTPDRATDSVHLFKSQLYDYRNRNNTLFSTAISHHTEKPEGTFYFPSYQHKTSTEVNNITSTRSESLLW